MSEPKLYTIKDANYYTDIIYKGYIYKEVDFNEKFDLKKITKVKKVDDNQTAYFIPNTEFPRKLFRQNYPNSKTCRLIKNADYVVYDDNSINIEKIIKFNYCNNIYNAIISGDQIITRDYEKRNNPKIGYADQRIYNQSFKIITKSQYDNYNNVNEIGRSSKPFIHVDDLFTNFNSEFREKELTTQDVDKYSAQIQSKDIDSVKMACSIVFALDPKKYLPIQYVLFNLFQHNNSIRTSLIKNIKYYQVFQKYVSGISGFQPYQGLDSINQLINIFNKYPKFKKDMDYDLALYCILSNKKSTKSKNLIDGFYTVTSIDCPKIDVDIEFLNQMLNKDYKLTQHQDIEKYSNENINDSSQQDEEIFDWGV